MNSFWDSSALGHLIVKQPYSERARVLKSRTTDIVVWWGTPVELRNMIARLSREGMFKDKAYNDSKKRLALLCKAFREVAPSYVLRELAERLTEMYELRTGEALQLAAALVWAKERPRNRPFVCFDIRLANAARQLGFDVWDQATNIKK